MTHPQCVTTCNLDMENLITDVNRSIATLAITTLLKVGAFYDAWLLLLLLPAGCGINHEPINLRLVVKPVSTD
jgi:hypothetical protein